ncbi:endonuclease MutS2 [Flavisolibacter ginsengisoli]|jgi:DNA mismatch repair protein MutS2|uniref:DNA mismatch repair protein MutS2 n=1 Tax=Flavisolibacter ginsengisoli DSM 18119 TaxID=1121884 RepID=A0A1M4SGC9_9BACT|nr:DNA mismatch repair protein MutS [Flavisolibacter ginsengisoli]SHE31249.1 DNA mismatch repair protein MutS2 [Flavisolibacter ginsengisoli DSM 18119]
MKLYPESASVQLEFDKIKSLLHEKCRFEYSKSRADDLRIHTRKEFIDRELRQSHEFRQLLQNGIYFPNDYILNLSKEIRLLQIEGAVLAGEQLVALRKLALTMESIFRWFDPERREAYPGLLEVIAGTYYEKAILKMIDDVVDETGTVKDNASDELSSIRMGLYRKRNELRKAFERIISKLNKQGYLADIEESFMSGRRVVAVFAEQKRMVKGILHGESDSRRTAFIEPEETIDLNNQLHELENAERKEVYRILKQLTKQLSAYSALLSVYHTVVGEYDFIRAKAAFAIDIKGEYPLVSDKALVHLVKACHPLLYLYNLRAGKPTIPVDLTLDEKNRVLVISGPNAGGKTVTMKTVGLLQMMVQSGLLVPVNPSSQFGIFKQLMIHIGDTQSIEFELSTYSSHLLSMKYFMENANGRTLFFIDELGSGSDPNLGGAFAEVIMEELARKHAIGIVTTHYLNLKVMANKTPGIVNGAMAFDEKNLLPLYKLAIGKPGSSYTFSIAERIGLDRKLIQKARALVDEDHFRLDKLLNRTEQDLQVVQQKERDLHRLLKENERLKKEMQLVMDQERHRQQVEVLQQQNKVTEDRIAYLKDMERKLRQIVIEWKKTEDKNKVVREMASLLFKKNEQKVVSKKQKQLDSKYEEVNGDIKVGDKVKMKKNLQVGEVLELRGKKAVVKIGMLPMQIDLGSLVLIKEKDGEEKK